MLERTLDEYLRTRLILNIIYYSDETSEYVCGKSRKDCAPKIGAVISAFERLRAAYPITILRDNASINCSRRSGSLKIGGIIKE